MLGKLDYVARYQQRAENFRSHEYALAYREVGISPDIAAVWANASVPPSEAQRRIGHGILSPAMQVGGGDLAHRQRADPRRRIKFAVKLDVDLPHHYYYAPDAFDSWLGKVVQVYQRFLHKPMRLAEAEVTAAEVVVGGEAVVLMLQAVGMSASSLRMVLRGGYSVGWLMPDVDAIAFTPVTD